MFPNYHYPADVATILQEEAAAIASPEMLHYRHSDAANEPLPEARRLVGIFLADNIEDAGQALRIFQHITANDSEYFSKSTSTIEKWMRETIGKRLSAKYADGDSDSDGPEYNAFAGPDHTWNTQ